MIELDVWAFEDTADPREREGHPLERLDLAGSELAHEHVAEMRYAPRLARDAPIFVRLRVAA